MCDRKCTNADLGEAVPLTEWQELVSERDTLRAQLDERNAALECMTTTATSYKSELAERDALLREARESVSYLSLRIDDIGSHNETLLERIDEILAASAEPSAPKCKNCGDTGVIEDKEKDELPGGEFVERGILACKQCEDQGAPVERDERAEFGSSVLMPSTIIKEMPNPTTDEQSSYAFEAIWQVTKCWDVNVQSHYRGYCGANGSHVKMILDGLEISPSKLDTASLDCATEIIGLVGLEYPGGACQLKAKIQCVVRAALERNHG